MSEPAGLPQLALSRVITTSLTALKAYLAGEQKFRRSQWEAAIAHFTRAVEADSTFALALYRLSRTYGWIEGSSARTVEYSRRAARFAHRLPEREALLLSGTAESAQGRLSGIEILEELTTRYPDGAEGWYALGEAYFHIGDEGLYPHEKFRTAFPRSIELDPSLGPAYIHLIDDAFTRMDSAGARTLIARYEEVDPAGPAAIGMELAYALAWGDSVARAEANAALDTAGAVVLEHASYALLKSGDLAEQVLPVAQALSDERHPLAYRQSGQSRIEGAYLIRGRLREARDVIEARAGEEPFGVTPSGRYLFLHLAGYADTLAASRAAWVLASDPAPVSRFLVGAFAASEERWEYVEVQVRALELGAQEAESQGDTLAVTERLAFAHALRGYVALRRGDRQIAVRTLEEALPRLPAGRGPSLIRTRVHALLRYEMGRLLLDLARPREAERYFRSLVKRPWLSGAPIEYYLGRTYEALGDGEKAKLHYARFVRWWEDCDPELRPWRERGRQALARLAREPVSY